MGAAMLIFGTALCFRYQEEIASGKEGSRIWVLTLLMGAAMAFSGGETALFLVFQGLLGAVMAFCCLVQLHRERVLRLRRAARRGGRKPLAFPKRELPATREEGPFLRSA